MPKRVLTGTVVSDKADKTVVVRVERRVKHPLYGKIIKLSKKYHAHDDANAYRSGEQVRIEECAPISKQKSWTVLERIGAAAVDIESHRDGQRGQAGEAGQGREAGEGRQAEGDQGQGQEGRARGGRSLRKGLNHDPDAVQPRSR